MTESEWLASTDPRAMLEHLTRNRTVEYPGVSDRKLRLFVCACCRQVWDRLTDERSRRAVEVAERYADGRATEKELREANQAATSFHQEKAHHGSPSFAPAWVAAKDNFLMAAERLRFQNGPMFDREAAAVQAALLRDIFGNPWRLVPGLQVAKFQGGVWHETADWLAWNDGTVPRIAQAIYNDRCFEEMPILADALEEAGCDNEEMLMHCRGQERVLIDEAKRQQLLAAGCRVLCNKGCCFECEQCSAKPGSPVLCRLCLELRTLCNSMPVNEGWRPLRGPHVRGCWVLDLLLGKE